MTGALALLLGVGLAADRRVVVYDGGSPQASAEQVRAALGEGGQTLELDPQRLGDLIAGPPQVIGGGHKESCRSPSGAEGVSAARFDERTREIVELVRAKDFERALNAARSAEALLPCMNEPVPSARAAEFYSYCAAAAARLLAEHDATSPQRAAIYRDEARRAFEAWRRFVGDEDELARLVRNMPDQDGRAIARAVLDARALSTSFHVVPKVDALWIDGFSSKPDIVHRLATGRHLVQIRVAPGEAVRSLWVILDSAAPATLAVPELLPADATGWVEQDRQREDLTALLSVLGEGEFYLVTPADRVWRGVAGDSGAWESLSAAPASGGALRDVGRISTISGAALAGAGLVAMGVTCLAGRAGADEELAWYQCGEEGAPLHRAFRVEQGAMLGGVGLVGLGLALNLAGGWQLEAGLGPLPGGGALRIGIGPARLHDQSDARAP